MGKCGNPADCLSWTRKAENVKTPLITRRTYKAFDASEEDLSALLDRVYKACRWDFRNYKSSSLKRRISKRLLELDLHSYAEYLEILDKNPTEYANLFSSITVKVSEFFREPVAFEQIRRYVQNNGFNEGLRAWCCGCANGEEAYSLAIIMSEVLTNEAIARTKVFATDIDRGALEAGRRALYREEFLKNVAPQLMDRYFFKSEGHYQIRYDIKNMVTFGALDIVMDRTFSKINILLCRNLFIYFKKSLQEEVFEKLDYALAAGGLLVLGKAEVVPQSFASGYELVDKGLSIYRKRL